MSLKKINSRHWVAAFCLTYCVAGSLLAAEPPAEEQKAIEALFARDNLIAWQTVKYDGKHRSPEERVAMLKELGFRKFAYDGRREQLPTFEQEIVELKKHGVELTAVWFPSVLNDDAKHILAVLEKHHCKVQLWVWMGVPNRYKSFDDEQVPFAVARLKPIVEAAEKIGCTVGLYNSGEWFGEPENQLKVIKALESPNVGMVYNLTHAEKHLQRLPELLEKMRPHLYAINLNGMKTNRTPRESRLLVLGQGVNDLAILRTIAASNYRGPLGILGGTEDDVEDRLRDNLDGLNWLVPQLLGQAPAEKPTPRTPAMQ